MVADKFNGYWIGTTDGLHYLYNNWPPVKTLMANKAEQKFIAAAFIDKTQLLISNYGGLSVANTATGSTREIPFAERVYSICAYDGDNDSIVVAGRNRLYWLNPKFEVQNIGRN
ncbi:MAG: hypothetical protein HC896_07975 [Bacteroidales bacterium]|nr:hypothetical protein [Bacteroidales bacterium]